MDTEKNTVTANTETTAAPKNSPKAERLLSLDALRGFDMFWIVGGAPLVKVAAAYFEWPWRQTLVGQLKHPKWEGFTFYDLIFPLFLFIAGVAIPFSMDSMRKKGFADWKIYLKIAKRAVLLLILGAIHGGALQFRGYDETRFISVLGLIGIGYFFAALIAMKCRAKGQIVWCIGILLGCWAALALIPVPGHGAGAITPEGSVSSYIDQAWLPGRLHFGTFDPQGILPCITAISTALFGTITGCWLKDPNRKKTQKAIGMFLAGIVLILIGILWGHYLPIIKNIWTSSYTVLVAGISLVALSLFYFVIDVIGLKKWAFFFVVIGVNPITIYLGSKIINISYTSDFFFKGLIGLFDKPLQPLMERAFYILTWWLLLLFLYRKKIFLKV